MSGELTDAQRELLDIVTGPPPAPYWYADHQRLAMVASYMIDGSEEYDVRDVIYMLEKPWKYAAEYQAAYHWIRAR